MLTDDIMQTIDVMKQRGCEFLKVPKSYYENLRKSLEKSSIWVHEDLDKIEELNILIDYDDNGYLL